MAAPRELGKIFAKKRESLKMTREEAYRKSRIHPSVIRDIEEGVFNRIGKLYVKSFLKKYSILLGLDTKSIMKKYEAISAEIPDKEFNLREDRGAEKEETPASLTERRVQAALVGTLSIVLVFLVFVLLGILRTKLISSPRPGIEAAQEKRISPASAEKGAAPAPAPVAAVAGKITLTLKAREEVWVQLARGKGKLFSGILKKGEEKTWKTDQTLIVWTGKAEALDFTVNNRNLGVIAAGVVKNIEISSGGIKIGNVWVNRFD